MYIPLARLGYHKDTACRKCRSWLVLVQPSWWKHSHVTAKLELTKTLSYFLTEFFRICQENGMSSSGCFPIPVKEPHFLVLSEDFRQTSVIHSSSCSIHHHTITHWGQQFQENHNKNITSYKLIINTFSLLFLLNNIYNVSPQKKITHKAITNNVTAKISLFFLTFKLIIKIHGSVKHHVPQFCFRVTKTKTKKKRNC